VGGDNTLPDGEVLAMAAEIEGHRTTSRRACSAG